MFCVVTETEYYGPYGPAGVSYLRESKDGEQRSFLFPGEDASIKLDCAGGRYEIRNIDGELLFLATVKNVYSSEIGYVRELFNRAMDCAVEYGAKNAMIDILSGRLQTPKAHKIILKIIDDFKLR